jgi:hypothetical protein
MEFTPTSKQPIFQWDRRSALLTRAVVPTPWRDFMNLLTQGSSKTTATVFVHQRTNPAGHRRLIGVNLLPQVSPNGDRWILDYESVVIELGAWLSEPRLCSGWRIELLTDHPAPITVLPAIIDESDASHFSFECREAEHSTIYDGWLRDDDTVVIEPRVPAPTPPAPPSSASSR